MSFWKLIEEKKIIINESKIHNSWKIHLVCYNSIKHIETILLNKNTESKEIKKHIENLSISLHEILKNSLDWLRDIKWLSNILKIKKIELRIYEVNSNYIIIVKDNWAWEKAQWTQYKKNNPNYLWWKWAWEKRINNFSNILKYKRVSKKSWTITLIKAKI